MSEVPFFIKFKIDSSIRFMLIDILNGRAFYYIIVAEVFLFPFQIGWSFKSRDVSSANLNLIKSFSKDCFVQGNVFCFPCSLAN